MTLMVGPGQDLEGLKREHLIFRAWMARVYTKDTLADDDGIYKQTTAGTKVVSSST